MFSPLRDKKSSTGKGGEYYSIMMPEEEQLALLGKMLLYSVDHLSGREKEVYDTLVENLSKRISRLQRLERQTERLKIQRGSPEKDIDEMDQSKKYVVKNLRPDQVVKKFIESWNEGKFDVEFYCLSKECEKGGRNNTPYPDYINKRKKKWDTRDIAGIIRKQMGEVSSSEMRGNRAVVHCVESHTTNRQVIMLWREYELLYEDGGWRIINFSTLNRKDKQISSPA
jgi:hypothetical protein